MQIGTDSFAAAIADPVTGATISPSLRLRNLLEEIELADQVGLDVFGIGEHHRREYLDSAPTIILAAAAERTKRIRLASAVTVLSAADPVRVFQEFATLDLISEGPCGDRRRAWFVRRGVSALWLRSRTITIRCSPKSWICCSQFAPSIRSVNWSGQASRGAHRARRVPATAAGPACRSGSAWAVRPNRSFVPAPSGCR